jgi:glutathione S-transferase
MTRELYELLGADDRRFSPYCWRARLALAHKGLEADYVPVGFTEKDKIAFSGQTEVPVLVDGETTIVDSWDIACHLEDTYVDAPTLFGGAAGRAAARFVGCWMETEVFPPLFRLLVADIHSHTRPEDRDYFRETREQRLGQSIEKCAEEAPGYLEPFRTSLRPARQTLKLQPFLCGETPAYADYILFGTTQWARGVSPLAVIEKDDPIHAWVDRMLELFDGLGRRVTAYDY